jgi:hypothetical protein
MEVGQKVKCYSKNVDFYDPDGFAIERERICIGGIYKIIRKARAGDLSGMSNAHLYNRSREDMLIQVEDDKGYDRWYRAAAFILVEDNPNLPSWW